MITYNLNILKLFIFYSNKLWKINKFCKFS